MSIKFNISPEQLLKPLQVVASAVERKQLKPILGNVLLVVKSQLLSITASDLEVEMVARVPLTEEASEGATTIGAKKLIEICKALIKNPSLTVSEDPTNSSKVLVKSNKSRYVVSSLPAKDFPRLDDEPSDIELSIKQSLLRSLFDQTSFAMALQDVRYFLNGIFCEFKKDSIQMVASDGHRLVTMQKSASFMLDDPCGIILPRKAVMGLQKLIAEGEEELGLQINKNHLRVITRSNSFSAKLIDGKYPDFNRLVLQKDDASVKKMTADKEIFRQALMRAMALLSEKSPGIRLRFTKDLLQIFVTNQDKDEVEDEVEISYAGPDVEIGVNGSYLLEYLHTIEADSVSLYFTSPEKSIMLEASLDGGDQPSQSQSNNKGNNIDGVFKHCYIVMPMYL